VIPSAVLAEIRKEYSTFIKNLSALSGGWTGQAQVPKDPVSLSYGVANNLGLPRHLCQQLLELPTASHRLQKLAPLIKESNQAIQEEIVKRNPFQGSRLN
jgi:hypothetical protein